MIKNDSYALSNFEGSLEFLLCLLQKEELDIHEIPIQELIHQFSHKLSGEEADPLDKGAEFIGTAAYLVWLKSKALLPHDTQTDLLEEQIEDPHFEIIHHLIDYCRFKQAAKDLSLRQEQQQACYFRGVEYPEWKKPMGIDHVSLEELAGLFKEMMLRAAQSPSQIQEEHWRVSDKIMVLRRLLKEKEYFAFMDLFSPHQSRAEMIVIFLAILELMKIGELAVGKHQPLGVLQIFVPQGESV